MNPLRPFVQQSPDCSDSRSRLSGLLAAVREAGVPLAFDPNYRPRLWEDAATARLWIDRAARMAGTILPTHENGSALFGDADSAATRARYVAAGIGEVVVKDGINPTLFSAGTDSGALAVPGPVRSLDTTGAGDAFNGAYLAARLAGQGAPAAIAAGQAVAGLVVQRPGALVAMAELAAQG